MFCSPALALAVSVKSWQKVGYIFFIICLSTQTRAQKLVNKKPLFLFIHTNSNRCPFGKAEHKHNLIPGLPAKLLYNIHVNDFVAKHRDNIDLRVATKQLMFSHSGTYKTQPPDSAISTQI